MIMYRRLTLLAGGLILLCITPLVAQDPALSQMYGSGVHAFFSQDYRQAYDHFTAAIDAGITDPRCYYFRGLAFLRLGREDEARMDFEEAARLEVEDINKFYNVGRALERIQGSTRLMVEQYRAEARVEAMKRAEKARQERYGRLREAEHRILETQAEAAPATPLPPGAPPQPATPPGLDLGLGPTETTSTGPDDVTMEPAETPAAPAQPPAPAPAPAEEDPFAVQPVPQPGAAPAAEPAAGEVPADVSGGSVFGALGRALGKAVAGEEAGEAAPAAVSDDPFAQPAAPAQPPAGAKPAAPMPAQPAVPADDPFAQPAAPAPAQPAAPADDPFAQPAAPAAAPPAGVQPAVPVPAKPAAPPGDPFAAPPGKQPAAEEDPFVEEKAAEKEAAPASDDPFAQDPANQ